MQFCLLFLSLLSAISFAQSGFLSEKRFTITIVSDQNTLVLGPDVSEISNAVSAWQMDTWNAKILGATWIWDRYQVSNPASDQFVTFMNSFWVVGKPLRAILDLAADDTVVTYVNGKTTDCISSGGSFEEENQLECDLTGFVEEGLNIIMFKVGNIAGGVDFLPTLNPAGLLYRLTVDVVA
jgi:hypothetical protein